MSEGEFSVWIFFPDGSHMAEMEWVDAETAVKCAKAVTQRRPARDAGLIERVIITDGGDFTVFEWEKGQVTFPLNEAEQTNGV